MQTMRNKKATRLAAMVLAAILLATVLAGGLSYWVAATVGSSEDTPSTVTGEAIVLSISNEIRRSGRVDVRIAFTAKAFYEPSNTTYQAIVSNVWWNLRSNSDQYADFVITKVQSTGEPGVYKVEATVRNLYYNSSEVHNSLRISRIYDNLGDQVFEDPIEVTIPTEYFAKSLRESGSSTDESKEEETYTSQIVYESARVYNEDGKTLGKLTKDYEGSFSVEVIYSDTGLRRASLGVMRGASLEAFFVPGGGFETDGSTKGTITMLDSGSAYPRFRVTFEGLRFNGTGNELKFQVFYLFGALRDPVAGEGAAVISAAKPEEEDEEDKDKMGIAVPKIIVDSYSYGEGSIVAGNEFNLDFSIRNTSAEVPVENIVMMMNPVSDGDKGQGLIVASSSNTIYVPSLGAASSVPYTVAFKARPDAAVTSHRIEITFSYEYIDVVKEERATAEMTESIAIPVSQIDRFTLDPILESPYATIGEEAYLAVSFANRGKSTISNVSASIRSENPALTAPSQYYGHVEAGKADSIDLYLTASEAGEYTGEVVIEYEDENGDTKEVTTPFTMMVEEPWTPPADDLPPPDMELEPGPAGPGALTIALCSIGGVAIAAPIALYLMKRVRAKASEEFFDEDI